MKHPFGVSLIIIEKTFICYVVIEKIAMFNLSILERYVLLVGI